MQMEISLEIYRCFQVWNAPNVISKTKSETTGLTRWGGRVRFSEAEAEADGPMDLHPVKCMDFLLESSPFQDPGDPGDSHGYPNSVRGNNRA